ncbi:DMT family transporter [Flaviaesturariibacter aridisoli]|uniref:EamA family transporter n=1 Tax=Flaviaesturariibacter aridisoli TaxID=2545761 RepID=A0A4R4DSP7_9BACT|nr:EamA family transporter [Flaviaesturariibacter aridisoli]TCZ65681.1 EamA family transporter [Flaviaesturariibacter aridisoli]
MRKALLQLHTAVFLWGFTGVLGRVITLSQTWLVWYRLLITVVSLWVLYAALGKVRRIPLRSALFIAFIGFILALHWVCFYGSIKYSNVTIALTCLSTTALLASFLEPIIVGRKFDWLEIGLGLFAIAGIILIYNTHLQFSTGIVIGLISALLTVLVSVTTKRIVDKYEPEALTLYQLTGGFIGLSILLPFYQHYFPEPNSIPVPIDWLWLTVLAWGCTILTFFLYIRALKKVSAFTMNLVLTLEPVYGILLAFAFYKENREVSPWFYAGFALISVAVVFHMWRLLRTKKEVLADTPMQEP